MAYSHLSLLRPFLLLFFSKKGVRRSRRINEKEDSYPRSLLLVQCMLLRQCFNQCYVMLVLALSPMRISSDDFLPPSAPTATCHLLMLLTTLSGGQLTSQCGDPGLLCSVPVVPGPVLKVAKLRARVPNFKMRHKSRSLHPAIACTNVRPCPGLSAAC